MEEDRPTISSYQVPLPANHAWSAQRGYDVIVANRGEARFNVPRGWVVEPGEGSDLCLYDRQPPDDECRLEFSLMRVPPMVGAGLALADLLDSDVGMDDVEVLSRTAPTHRRRGGLELVWNELYYHDPETRRLAMSRMCIARDSGVHVVLTMTMWADDKARLDPVWREVRRSLELSRPVDLSGRDPRRN